MNPDQIEPAPRRGGVIRPSELPGYSPANHHGTTNVRLVGPETGARHMEVVLGEIVAGGTHCRMRIRGSSKRCMCWRERRWPASTARSRKCTPVT